MADNSLYVMLIGLPLFAAPLVYLLGRISARRGEDWGLLFARWFTVVILVLDGIVLYFATYGAVHGTALTTLTVGSITLNLDGVGLVVSAVAIGLGLCVAIFSTSYMANEEGEEKFYALLLITIGAIVGMLATRDLFNLWVWFEVMAVSTYFLVAFYNKQPASLEAGVKYLVQSAIGSTLVLFGIAVIYSQTGSASMQTLFSSRGQGMTLVGLGGLLMIVGFGVKAALVPLHTWLPDAHSQAPSGISAMLSGIVIEAGLAAMLRVLSVIGPGPLPWGYILIGFGCLNILFGNLLALRQKEVKRLLAFSSLSHVGYMLLGFGFAFAYGFPEGAQGGFFHLITHSMMKGLAFLAAGALLYALFISRGDHSPLTLDDLNGASSKYPLTAFAFSVAVLGLGGLPPMAGFWSKWQILLTGIAVKDVSMTIIVVFAALNSILSLAYYAPMVNRIYRKQPSIAVQNGNRISWQMAVPMVIMVAVLIAIGVYPQIVNFITSAAATHLMGIFIG